MWDWMYNLLVHMQYISTWIIFLLRFAYYYMWLCVLTDIWKMNYLIHNIQFNICYCDKMSYCAKLCHFWEFLGNKFVQTIVVCEFIRNMYIFLNNKLHNTQFCMENDSFHHYICSIVYQKEVECYSHIIS